MTIDSHEVAGIANDVIKSGALTSSLVVSAFPLMDAWKNEDQSLKASQIEQSNLVRGKFLWENMPDGNKGIPVGKKSYLSQEAIRHIVSEIRDDYNPQVRFLDWLKAHAGNAGYSSRVLGRRNQGEWPTMNHSHPQGGYMVPQEYRDKIVANLDLLGVVRRKMSNEIAAAIDNILLSGSPRMTVGAALRRVFNDPTAAALDAVGYTPTKAPHMYRGFDAIETRSRRPGTIYGRNGKLEILGHAPFLGSSYITVGDESFPCGNVTLEQHIDHEQISPFMGEISRRYRIRSAEMCGNLEMKYIDYRSAMAAVVRTNAPVSGIEFHIRTPEYDLSFHGAFTDAKSRMRESIWGYPAYITDGGDYASANESTVKVDFVAYGAVHMQSRSSGFSVESPHLTRNLISNPSCEVVTSKHVEGAFVDDEDDDEGDEDEGFVGW